MKTLIFLNFLLFNKTQWISFFLRFLGVTILTTKPTRMEHKEHKVFSTPIPQIKQIFTDFLSVFIRNILFICVSLCNNLNHKAHKDGAQRTQSLATKNTKFSAHRYQGLNWFSLIFYLCLSVISVSSVYLCVTNWPLTTDHWKLSL